MVKKNFMILLKYIILSVFCTANLQHLVFLAKFSFILRGLRGYIFLVAAMLRCDLCDE